MDEKRIEMDNSVIYFGRQRTLKQEVRLWNAGKLTIGELTYTLADLIKAGAH